MPYHIAAIKIGKARITTIFQCEVNELKIECVDFMRGVRDG